MSKNVQFHYDMKRNEIFLDFPGQGEEKAKMPPSFKDYWDSITDIDELIATGRHLCNHFRPEEMEPLSENSRVFMSWE